ncbi:hypothetical protein Q604_UNBC18379G0010 [human gut metagenome]|uniref:site-specific DNA-methyltransferase (adenine-specific) n=1 Tax=human gut metagenome TaxID=408170 RepID=W1WSF4_9ZZZZ
MKVINSLFLDELNDEFESHKNDVNKLKKLIDRLSKIKIFDPACGSGNFLIIAYKEMRELEMRIINQINKIDRQIYMKETGISLDQFYGIELKDFAQQIAKLSLWLIEKKMDFRFYNEFGHSKPLLPLVESSRIINGNATRLEWNEICGISSEDEIYVLGNPPYLGSKVQDSEQRQDMDIVFKGIKKYKELDYIACWFYKGAKFIKGYNAKCAFVSTNSICQGEQVGLLWPNIFNQGIIIDFAHTSFKWGNNAKKNAAVICVIVGIVNNYEKNNRKIYQNNIVRVVKNINPYLIPGENIIIKKTKKTISALPPIFFGSMANDNNNLLLSNDAKEEIIRMNPNASKYIKKLIGAKQITQNQQRWCIWLKDVEKDIINKIEEFNTRIDMVREYRLNSTREATRKLAQTPHLFGEIRQPQHNYIAIPRHSSEKREYIPINMYTKDDIVNDSCMAVETNELWIMGVLMSYMHMLWVRTVGGRIKTDYRYSADICYNAFPFPNISNKKKDIISGYTIKVIEEREKNSGKTLAELYNPETMPLGLREAHNNLNLVIERCYIEKEFKTDEERLECLFKLYEEMI